MQNDPRYGQPPTRHAALAPAAQLVIARFQETWDESNVSIRGLVERGAL